MQRCQQAADKIWSMTDRASFQVIEVKRIHIMTDDHPGYRGLKKDFRRHSTIRYSWKAYAREEGDVLISTNTIEGYFSILKRGINGVYHHVGKQHLHRYLSEFDFRCNSRHIEDGERSLLAIRKVAGKRLKYRDSSRP